MALKTFKPYTKSTRGTILVDRTGLWKGKPFKTLVSPKNAMKGRNNNGHITSINRAGGHKKMYRHVDFYRKKFDMEATVERIEYDPNRTAYIALIKYEDGVQSYILAPKDVKSGEKIISGESVEIKPGNSMLIKHIPVGIDVHNLELNPGGGGILARSAGAALQVVGKSDGYVSVKLPSGELRKVLEDCRATVGVLSNIDKKNQKLGKAGRNRWLGKRPSVRGVAMNPIDHPHGGGEGKTSGGRHPVTPWGKPTKGKKTRSNKRTDKYIIKRKTDKKARIEV